MSSTSGTKEQLLVDTAAGAATAELIVLELFVGREQKAHGGGSSIREKSWRKENDVLLT